MIIGKFIEVDRDYDYRISIRKVKGLMTKNRYKFYDGYARKNTFRGHCGCERDCCGCLSSQDMRLEKTEDGWLLRLGQSFNY